MDIEQTDNIYLIAIRARGEDGSFSVRRVLDKIGPEIRGNEENLEYVAQVVAFPLAEAYRTATERPGVNRNDVLQDLGFNFDAANQVIPVATEETT